MSWYLIIRGAPDYSRFAATVPLVEFLSALPELRQTGPVAFQAAHGEPWVEVMMARCNADGNYAFDGAFVLRVNVVELVCSYSGDTAWYDGLAGRIAGFLGWQVIDAERPQQLLEVMTKRDLFDIACEAWRHVCQEQGWEFVEPVFEKSNIRVELNNVGLCTANGTMVAIYHEGQAGRPAPARCVFHKH